MEASSRTEDITNISPPSGDSTGGWWADSTESTAALASWRSPKHRSSSVVSCRSIRSITKSPLVGTSRRKGGVLRDEPSAVNCAAAAPEVAQTIVNKSTHHHTIETTALPLWTSPSSGRRLTPPRPLDPKKSCLLPLSHVITASAVQGPAVEISVQLSESTSNNTNKAPPIVEPFPSTHVLTCSSLSGDVHHYHQQEELDYIHELSKGSSNNNNNNNNNNITRPSIQQHWLALPVLHQYRSVGGAGDAFSSSLTSSLPSFISEEPQSTTPSSNPAERHSQSTLVSGRLINSSSFRSPLSIAPAPSNSTSDQLRSVCYFHQRHSQYHVGLRHNIECVATNCEEAAINKSEGVTKQVAEEGPGNQPDGCGRSHGVGTLLLHRQERPPTLQLTTTRALIRHCSATKPTKNATLMQPPPLRLAANSEPHNLPLKSKLLLVMGLGGVIMHAQENNSNRTKNNINHRRCGNIFLSDGKGIERAPDAEIFVRSGNDLPASGVNIFYRPHIASFLSNVLWNFDIAIFSTQEQDYVDALLDVMDPSGQVFPKSRRYYQQHCTKVKHHDDHSGEEKMAKDLRILGRPLNEVVLVDDDVSSGFLQPRNLLLIPTWAGDITDTALPELAEELVHITHSNDVFDTL